MNTGVPQARDFLPSLLVSLVEKPKSHNFFPSLTRVPYEESAVDQYVCGLDIPMYDILPMQVAEPQCHLIAYQSQRALGELLAEQLGCLPIPAVLHQNVVVLAILDVTVQLDDVGMIQF